MNLVKNVAFVALPATNYFNITMEMLNMPPIGLLSLATFISQHDEYNIKVFDLQYSNKRPFDEFKQQLFNFKPDILGFTVYPDNWENLRVLLPILRKDFPDTIFIVGGPLPTFIPSEIMTKLPDIDFVVMGEGELTLNELLKTINSEKSSKVGKNIAGICYRAADSNKITINKARPPIENLDSLPIVDRSFIDVTAYKIPFNMMTSRGCTGKCIFCSAGAMYKKLRKRSVANIIKEIKQLNDLYNAELFAILDDTFVLSQDNILTFCEEIKRLNFKVTWVCETRADVINPEIAKIMREAGCIHAQIGLESADNSILKKIRKGTTVEKIEYAIKCFNDVGISLFISYILGHAWDTKESMYRTIKYTDYLIEKYNASVYPSLNTPFPGTYQYDHAEELGIKIHAKSWGDLIMNKPVISGNYFSLEDLREISFDAFKNMDRLNKQKSVI